MTPYGRASWALIAEAMETLDVPAAGPLIRETEYEWRSFHAGFALHVPRRGGWVAITEAERVELGIPDRSLRGNGDISFADLALVDRRCLKRYRRKAGRR